MDKQNAIKLLDETFSNDFDTHRFAKFIKELFNNFNINQKSWTVWSEYQDYIESYNSLGSYTDKSKKVIDVLIVKLKRTSSRDRARTMQRNFIAKYLGNADKDAALVAFYGDDEDWRFSFVKMEYNLLKDEEGKAKVAKELTPAKRYSFLVGINEPNHTCKRQFLELVTEDEINPSVGEIEDAFSIDKVTKEFFMEYKRLYERLQTSLDHLIKKDASLRKEFEDKAISTIDFAKKLLGQIVFIYFLQKKGWLGVKYGEQWGTGPKDFLKRLYNKEIIDYDNFFNDALEPLFYDALANPREGEDGYYQHLKCKIPFLNGGLFEPINDYDWIKTEIKLDNDIFRNILATFDRYNFTVKEDEPLEKEVAIDPEMLGKVFENLIEENIRKGQGAYYTPREIVHYMCQQSLINYLETNTGILREDIEKFIQLGDFALDILIKEKEKIKRYGRSYVSDEEHKLPKSIREDYRNIDELLKNIKIVDPAVGSGAFPVGMMNEIVRARSILSIFLSDEEQKKRTNYSLKREVIENCLYGVDIDSSAVDIAKLRFWLSLIVDELDMKNIKPLPNLDHKIMCGNSLLEEFEGHKLFDDKLLGETKRDYSFEIKQINAEISKLNQELHQIHTGKIKNHNGRSKEIVNEIKKLQRKKEQILSAPKEQVQQATIGDSLQKRIKESQKKLKELRELQQKFFNEQNRKLKKQYRDDIERIEWELVEETLKEQGNEEAMNKLQQYKKNKSKPFFLWKLYFAEVFQRENPGFDVVIANPPYVDSEHMVKEMPEQRDKIAEKFVTAKGNWDLYIPFYELGFNITRSDGGLAYITPNKWLAIGYGAKLREFFQKYIQKICICDKIRVFEAGNTPEIIIVRKEERTNPVIICSYDEDYILSSPMHVPRSVLLKGNWGLLISPNLKLLLKIVGTRERLADYCDVENPFTVSEAYELVKCVYEGDKNNKANDLKLINTGTIDPHLSMWGRKETSYIKKKYVYPLISKTKFQKNMPNRFAQSVTAKIIISGIRYFDCYIDTDGMYVAGKSTIIIRNPKRGYTLFGLMALLNSKLISFFMREAYSATGIGGGANFTSPMVEDIPFQTMNLKEINNLKKYSEEIHFFTEQDDYLDNLTKQSKVKKLEKEIDQLVYKLYELNPEEIKIVEEFGK